MGLAIGIDLGTTNSVMAVIKDGKPFVIPNIEADKITPSVVAFNPVTGQWAVGISAVRQAILNPDTTICSFKRFMGCRLIKSGPRESTIKDEIRNKNYRIAEGPDHEIRVVVAGKEHSPEEIASLILQKMKADAEVYLGEKVTDAVLTVPAYFDDMQRKATKKAGEIAGLKVLRIISEPTAAALAYGLYKNLYKKKEGILAVYHLGAGTFDISILDIGERVFDVKSTSGDTYLGGDDFTQRIIDWLVDEFKRDNAIDLHADRIAMQRLKEAAEKAKIELSSIQSTEINLPNITADASGPKHFTINLTRSRLEQLVMDLADKTLLPCQQALSDAGLTTAQVDEVILVGGQTRMPLVQDKMREFFKKEPSKQVNPDEAVAIGAAIQAAVLKSNLRDPLLLDVTPLTLGIETIGGIVTPVIQRNTTIPTLRKQVFSTTVDSQTSIDIHIVQGEQPKAADNLMLGHFVLDGIPPAPCGVPQIEVTFEIDQNGILSVNAGHAHWTQAEYHPDLGR